MAYVTGTPVESYNNPRFKGPHQATYAPGNKGGPGLAAFLKTAFGSNGDIQITAQEVGVAGNAYSLQIVNPSCFSFSGRAYFGTIPAAVTINGGASASFRLTAVTGGTGGNAINITLVNPGGTQSLSVSVTGNAITVNLATSSGSITSTSAQVVTALQGNAAASALVEAELTVTSSGAITAVTQTFLAGGATSANNIYVLPSTNSAGTINETATNLVTLLKSVAGIAQAVSVALAQGQTGAGTVGTMSLTNLAGGVDATGLYADVRQNSTIQQSGVDSLGPGGFVHSRNSNVGIEARDSRVATPRFAHSVPGQMVAIEKTDPNNYPKEHGPRSQFL